MTDRFEFGKNWKTFIHHHLNEETIQQSRKALCRFLGREDLSLAGLSFLDIGCGSGLSSLAAWRAGASPIVSFDYDPHSVAATRELHRLAGSPQNWTVMQGDALNEDFLRSLPKADIVYSWGVLHHTGNMKKAVDNAALCCKSNGLLYLALYSHANYLNGTLHGHPSPEERLTIKQTYLHAGKGKRRLMELRELWRSYCGGSHGNPVAICNGIRRFWQQAKNSDSRGMRIWTDLRDWLGGWPMEFVHEQELCRQICADGVFSLLRMDTGLGNTSFLFRKNEENGTERSAAGDFWTPILQSRTYTTLAPSFEPATGHAYACPLTIPAGIAPWRLRLRENDQWLAFANAPREAVSAFGAGRYILLDNTLYFSSSDNTDPNTNGRTYTWFIDVNQTM